VCRRLVGMRVAAALDLSAREDRLTRGHVEEAEREGRRHPVRAGGAHHLRGTETALAVSSIGVVHTDGHGPELAAVQGQRAMAVGHSAGLSWDRHQQHSAYRGEGRTKSLHKTLPSSQNAGIAKPSSICNPRLARPEVNGSFALAVLWTF